LPTDDGGDVTSLNLLLLDTFQLLSSAVQRAREVPAQQRERGDIPGWVMIAIMSAAVVVVLIPLVGSKVGDAFSNAIDSVSGANAGK
jgi:hypothetical protein